MGQNEFDAADQLTSALEALRAGDTTTQPVSISLPKPLLAAFRSLSDAGVISSLSAAATEALTRSGYNLLLRLALEEIYAESPETRPSEQRVQEVAERLGVSLADGQAGRVA
ncbi:MAG: hypothetical protein ACR2MA_12425 [Egibacteraceae bacterium]